MAADGKLPACQRSITSRHACPTKIIESTYREAAAAARSTKRRQLSRRAGNSTLTAAEARDHWPRWGSRLQDGSFCRLMLQGPRPSLMVRVGAGVGSWNRLRVSRSGGCESLVASGRTWMSSAGDAQQIEWERLGEVEASPRTDRSCHDLSSTHAPTPPRTPRLMLMLLLLQPSGLQPLAASGFQVSSLR